VLVAPIVWNSPLAKPASPGRGQRGSAPHHEPANPATRHAALSRRRALFGPLSFPLTLEAR
jgi:hypothetical protein